MGLLQQEPGEPEIAPHTSSSVSCLLFLVATHMMDVEAKRGRRWEPHSSDGLEGGKRRDQNRGKGVKRCFCKGREGSEEWGRFRRR